MGDERRILEELEPSLRQWGDAQACAMLALVAGEQVSISDEELQSALRRALLVLAAGGDPHRELELDGPAVTRFAQELDSHTRRAALEASLGALSEEAAGLPRASFLLQALIEDRDLAWRSLAVALIADELGDTDE
jgi:hypothetical protein